jgi:hypothetical protein
MSLGKWTIIPVFLFCVYDFLVGYAVDIHLI